jgi:XTP/dITP diphosphohydrolase
MSARRVLLVATTNKKKLVEIEEALRGLDVELRTLADVKGAPEVDETGATFEENAALKAAALSTHSGLLTLADDSGLEVDALGGKPGVHSARYASAGPGNASDAANRAKLLTELAGVPTARRTARFRCAIAVARGGDVVLRSEGAVEGTILTEERGAGGFGYDPLFVPEGLDKTFGELPAAVKQSVSHRGRALRALFARLAETLGVTRP